MLFWAQRPYKFPQESHTWRMNPPTVLSKTDSTGVHDSFGGKVLTKKLTCNLIILESSKYKGLLKGGLGEHMNTYEILEKS